MNTSNASRGCPKGSYLTDPTATYVACTRNVGSNILYQFIPLNPMRIGNQGYDNKTQKDAITSEHKLVRNGLAIDSPEAVVAHMERHLFPAMTENIRRFDEDQAVAHIVKREREVQDLLGPGILKLLGGEVGVTFPHLQYGLYGYENYFMAYALYPEIIEKDFSLQADFARLNNQALARARREAHIPPVAWLGHDMADSRSTLVSLESLEQLWFPHFARAIEPINKTDIKMIWHCDGNLMGMLPGLIRAGIKGLQGFQYEDGMDYEKICAMQTRDGEPLVIWAGVSVTTTLPYGTAADVRKELEWLVEKGPAVGLFLAASSAVLPGTPWENIAALLEGLRYYREKGRV
jgi:hypothetical protein